MKEGEEGWGLKRGGNSLRQGKHEVFVRISKPMTYFPR